MEKVTLCTPLLQFAAANSLTRSGWSWIPRLHLRGEIGPSQLYRFPNLPSEPATAKTGHERRWPVPPKLLLLGFQLRPARVEGVHRLFGGLEPGVAGLQSRTVGDHLGGVHFGADGLHLLLRLSKTTVSQISSSRSWRPIATAAR